MSRPRQPGLRSAEGSTRASHPPFDVLNNAVAVMMHRGSLTMNEVSHLLRTSQPHWVISQQMLADVYDGQMASGPNGGGGRGGRRGGGAVRGP
ncbi:hypothetical protein VYU27_003107 [Nannochloropsis oceanica]